MKRSRPRVARAVAASIVGLLSVMLLAGCGLRPERALMEAPSSAAGAEAGKAAAPGAASSSAPSAADESAARESLSATLPQAGALPTQRMVIKTAGLDIRVRDVASAFGRAVRLVEADGGYVQASSQESYDGDRADLTIRIGPEKFLPLVASLEGLGVVLSKSISGEDVTEEYYDLDAQLANLSAVRGRLLDLLQRAVKVTDAIEVEKELERVGGELNRIEGRMRYLKTMVGLSTINLTLSTEERPAAEPFINWSLVGNGFVVAARTLVQVLFFILQALVVVVPIAVIVAAAAWGIWLLVRLVRGRGAAGVERTARSTPAAKSSRPVAPGRRS